MCIDPQPVLAIKHIGLGADFKRTGVPGRLRVMLAGVTVVVGGRIADRMRFDQCASIRDELLISRVVTVLRTIGLV